MDVDVTTISEMTVGGQSYTVSADGNVTIHSNDSDASCSDSDYHGVESQDDFSNR